LEENVKKYTLLFGWKFSKKTLKKERKEYILMCNFEFKYFE